MVAKQSSRVEFLLNDQEMDLLKRLPLLSKKQQEFLKRCLLQDDGYVIVLSDQDIEEFIVMIQMQADQTERTDQKYRLMGLVKRFNVYWHLSQNFKLIATAPSDKKQTTLSGSQSDPQTIKNNHAADEKKIIVSKQAKSEVFVFLAKMLGLNCMVERWVAVEPTKSLRFLAESILAAFDFELDHCFGFYDNFKKPHQSSEVYEVFADLGEDPHPKARGVMRTRIRTAYRQTQKSMMLLFDYGEGWRFEVRLVDIRAKRSYEEFPQLIKAIGDAPLQSGEDLDLFLNPPSS